MARVLLVDLSLESSSTSQARTGSTIKDLLLLNYSTLIRDGFSYCVMVLIFDGICLTWRLYIDFYRPMTDKGVHTVKAARGLIKFFMEGPRDHKPIVSHRLFKASDLDIKHLPNSRDKPNSKWDNVATITQTIDLLGSKPLSKVHQKVNMDRLTVVHDGFHPSQTQWYKNPIKSINLEKDYSCERWIWLFSISLVINILNFSIGIPVVILAIVGLNHSAQQSVPPIAYEGSEKHYNRLLVYYGHVEITYVCMQNFLLLATTNIFIGVFYADLIYKSRSIRQDLLSHLNHLTKIQSADPFDVIKPRKHDYETRKVIHYQQLRLWSYFTYIDQLDTFMSKYSIVSRALFILGISFGQSFIRTGDQYLRIGTAAIMIGNFCSFCYMHLLSWHIESKVSLMDQNLSYSFKND